MLAPHFINLRRLDTAISLLKKERVNNSARSLHLAEAYRLLGRSGLARKSYRKAEKLAKLEVRVGFLTVRANHAYVLAAQGDLFDAEREVQRTLEDWPACMLAIYTQALIERRRGDNNAVERTLERMLPLSPHQVVCALTDPDFTPLLSEQRFRRLLAWALGARRANIERLRNRASAV
jgi:Flp pilus assembly protein TadD